MMKVVEERRNWAGQTLEGPDSGSTPGTGGGGVFWKAFLQVRADRHYEIGERTMDSSAWKWYFER